MRLALIILALTLSSGCHSDANQASLAQPISRSAYPENDAGFRAFINDLLSAHGKSRDVQRFMNSLVIPNSSGWFIENFGPTLGPILDFQYRHQLGSNMSYLYAYLPGAARDPNLQILLGHPVPLAGRLSSLESQYESRIISLADQPLKLYFAQLSNGDWLLMLGNFVYVNGAFRLLGHLEIDSNAEQLHREYDKPFEDYTTLRNDGANSR